MLIDAIVLKIRHGQVANRPVYLAMSISIDGEHDMLGTWTGPFGGKEGDLIVGVGVGVGGASAMMTLRERKTQYGIIINLPLDHTAKSVNAAAIAAFAALPPHMRGTLTWDQGVEMARHQELADATGVKIYFAERSSPWQRGANENFNGLARQYFPKGTDLSVTPRPTSRRSRSS